MDKIIEYKSLNKKEKYLESWTNLKQILVYLKPYKDYKSIIKLGIEKDKNITTNEIEELLKLLENVDMDKYQEISDEANQALTNLYDSMKNEKNGKNNLQNVLNETLKKILEDNLFDELFNCMCKFYIFPFFNDVIIKNLQKGDTNNNRLEIKKISNFVIFLLFSIF